MVLRWKVEGVDISFSKEKSKAEIKEVVDIGHFVKVVKL